MFDKIIYFSAVLTNVLLIVFALYIGMFEHGSDAKIALLFVIPPILSIVAISQNGGIEVRRLKCQVQKAELRKKLKELEDFTK